MTGPRPSAEFPAVDPTRDLPAAVELIRRVAAESHPYDALLHGMAADVLEERARAGAPDLIKLTSDLGDVLAVVRERGTYLTGAEKSTVVAALTNALDALRAPARSREQFPAAVPFAEHERQMVAQIEETDRASEAADQLAAALAPSVIVGEHSSANDPWRNALDYAGGPWGSSGARYGPDAPARRATTPADDDRGRELAERDDECRWDIANALGWELEDESPSWREVMKGIADLRHLTTPTAAVVTPAQSGEDDPVDIAWSLVVAEARQLRRHIDQDTSGTDRWSTDVVDGETLTGAEFAQELVRDVLEAEALADAPVRPADELAHVRVGDDDPTGDDGNCPARDQLWRCTREEGHQGQHIAGDGSQGVKHVWHGAPCPQCGAPPSHPRPADALVTPTAPSLTRGQVIEAVDVVNRDLTDPRPFGEYVADRLGLTESTGSAEGGGTR